MSMRSIDVQYLLESFLAIAFVAIVLVPRLRRRDPRKVLAVLVGLNLLRFGGVAGSLAALPGAPVPWFLVQVAVGDALAAVSALLALFLLLRRSRSAAFAVVVSSALGLAGILVSEACLGWLEGSGRIARATFVHGPTVGAAVFTAIHVLALHGVYRTRRRVDDVTPLRTIAT